MKHRVRICALSAIVLFVCATGSILSNAQPGPNGTASTEKWAGVWQGELDGHPSVVLTLANDTGQLGGTVVLNIIQKENGDAREVAKEPHVLMNPSVDGEILAFQCRKLDGGFLDFTVKLTGADEANIHCSNCGAEAPTVDLVRGK
ncbi:MAG TPA: hypothetical protein VH308_12235 [Terracidiphilus sp.]|jgi:hypothetical protein|nr:hypothetical protein [Terracidiphilus sp.]